MLNKLGEIRPPNRVTHAGATKFMLFVNLSTARANCHFRTMPSSALCNLARVNFANAYFRKSNFANAYFRKKNILYFRCVVSQECTFANAEFRKNVFSQMRNFARVYFRKCVLSQEKYFIFMMCSFARVYFRKCGNSQEYYWVIAGIRLRKWNICFIK